MKRPPSDALLWAAVKLAAICLAIVFCAIASIRSLADGHDIAWPVLGAPTVVGCCAAFYHALLCMMLADW